MKKLLVTVMLATVCQFTFGNTSSVVHRGKGGRHFGYYVHHLIPGKGLLYYSPRHYTPSHPHYIDKTFRIGGW